MKRRKVTAAAMALIGLGIGLTGCGQSASPARPAQSQAQQHQLTEACSAWWLSPTSGPYAGPSESFFLDASSAGGDIEHEATILGNSSGAAGLDAYTNATDAINSICAS
jgi:hypothetical protein